MRLGEKLLYNLYITAEQPKVSTQVLSMVPTSKLDRYNGAEYNYIIITYLKVKLCIYYFWSDSGDLHGVRHHTLL